jgi:hypothetical protein
MPEPSFTYESSRKLYGKHTPKPPPLSPRVAAAGRAMRKVTSREARHQVADGFVRQIPADVDPRSEIELIHALRDGLDAAEDTQRTEELTQEVTAALQSETPPTERSGPYLDDAGRLRDTSGNVVDDPERAAETLRTLATTDYAAANALLDSLEDTDPAMAGQIVDHLGGGE